MSKHELIEEIRKLSNLLSLYQFQYYVKSKSLVSDLEYDYLFDRLLTLEQENPELRLPDSPSGRVGSDLSKDIPEVSHTIPVLSLDKEYTIENIIKWMDKTVIRAGTALSFVVEEKIDGVSIVLYYKNGILDLAATRGNGKVGNDITENVRTIKSVPLRLKEAIDIVVRGEIFLPLEKFEHLNSKLEVPFANPRNLTAGTLRRKKSINVASTPLDIFIYEGFLSNRKMNHLEILKYLKKLGFKVSNRIGAFTSSILLQEQLSRCLENVDFSGDNLSWVVGDIGDFSEYIKTQIEGRRTSLYEIDGLVIKVNETDVRETFGFTGHHPRWAIAYKFESPEGVSCIRAIDIQIGRTGRTTPVARVDPVCIGGSIISNVTLHNQGYINLLELAIGDTVSISKRGDVIPAVDRVIDKNKDGNSVWQIPTNCPSCNSHLVQNGAHHFCINSICSAQVKGRIFFFLGKDQMDIDGFGSETADLLISKGYIIKIADIYTFNYKKLDKVPGFGSKKIEIISKGVKRSLEQPYSRVLSSLGIPELGKKVVELLINAGYRNIDDLIKIAMDKDVAKLIKIKGIGERIAKSIIDEFSSTSVLEMVHDLKEVGLNFIEKETEKETLPTIFKDQVWCITGSFKNFKPRTLAEIEITKRGGRITTGVTGNTTHLLAGESAGSKLIKAQDLGTNIITEDMFMDMLK